MYVDKNIKILIFVFLVFMLCIYRKSPIKFEVKRGGYDNYEESILQKIIFPSSRTF